MKVRMEFKGKGQFVYKVNVKELSPIPENNHHIVF